MEEQTVYMTLDLRGKRKSFVFAMVFKFCYLLKANSSKQPIAICGDLDSVRPDVLSHYRQGGVRILKDVDQYTTDFIKCLSVVAERVRTQATGDPRNYERHDVAIFGGLGGRADQAFSNLNLLYANQGDRRHLLYPSWVINDLYLITPESIIFCLREGESEICTPVGPGALGESVGIIPLGTPATITTAGLEWDVKDWPTAFGGQVSTSNHIKSASVTVKSTARVLFTVEVSKEPFTGKKS